MSDTLDTGESQPVTPPPESPAATAEAPVADEKEDDQAPAPGGEEKAPSRTLVRSLAALAIVFFVGTVVAAIFAASQHRQLQQSKDARAGVEQVASRFASAVLSYDYRDLDKTKNTVLALSTGKFRTDYEQNFPGLSALFTTTKGQSTATVKDVFVSAIAHDTATAIVVLDERAQGTSGQRLNVDWYVRVSLVQVRGQWRVDDLTNINQTGAVPGQTPSTTAPPK